jgi:hypothetical protein
MCENIGTAGSSVYVNLNCWSGSVNGDLIYIRSGYALDYGGGKGWSPVCGSGDADEYSYYQIGVSDHGGLEDGYGCGHLRILEVSGTSITFKLEDFAGNSYIKTLDFASLLDKRIPTPVP